MSWLRVFIHRLRGLFLKRKMDQELEDEIRAHLEMQIEDNLRQGMGPDEARYAALRKFGGVEQVKESYRDRRSLVVMDSALWDLRYALRMLSRNPGFTAVAVLTLALGIGANTAIFSMFEGVVLAPLPYRQAERLVAALQPRPDNPRGSVSGPDFQDWRRNARSFEQMVGMRWISSDLTSPGVPTRIAGREISSGIFNMLGVNLSLGREFSPEEDRRGGNPVIIISNRLWQDRFGASRDALGQSVMLDGIDRTIVGVLTSNFEFWGEADFYTPIMQNNLPYMDDRTVHSGIFCIGRLKPGVTIDQAKSEMTAAMKKTASSWRTAYQQLTERIQQIPGVEAAAFTQLVPLSLGGNIAPFWVGPKETTSPIEAPTLQLNWTGPEYLKTMELPLLRGRFLTPEDNIQSEKVIVIDNILARTYFPDKDPVGQTITINIWGAARIVGVVGHVRFADEEAHTKNQAYTSVYQLQDDWVPVMFPGLNMVVRAKDYPFYPAAHGEFHLLAGRPAAAAEYFEKALKLARSRSETEFFERKLRACRPAAAQTNDC
jgi:MacB-like protein